MEAESPQNPEIKEGFGLLGEVHYEDLGNGRLKCLETGHELLLKDVDSYGNSKKCRLALIDRALQNKRAPLNSFEQSPLDRCKLICKLTGDTINKTEEHIWKHISGRKFQNKLGFYGSKSLEYGSVKLTLIRCSPSIYSWKRKAKFYGFVSCKEQVFARAEYKLGHMKDALEELDVSEVFMATLCDYYNLSTELIPYKDALSWQKRLVEAKQALLEEDGDVCGSLVVLQHPPVYTLGTRSSEKYLHFDLQHSPIDIFRTDRGGEVTYHGPGQLVMYPIMNLRHYKMDLHWYLRALEEVIIRALWSGFSVKGSRIDGLTGVWVGNQKVAAIGIHVSRWITYHGLAINVTTDLKPFSKIVPCGISDRAVGSLFEILNSTSCQDVAIPRLKGSSQTLDASTLLDLTLKSLLKEFSEVFQVDLIEKITLDVRSISEFANS